MKKNLLKPWHIIIMLILPILLPIIFHFAYYFPAKHDWLVAQISIGELMEYTGTTFGSIFLFFTVYLTIRNTRKDSKIEKLRDVMADYQTVLSPYFTVNFLLEKDPLTNFETLRKFIDDENKKYQILTLYLTEADKKIISDEFEPYRLAMITSQVHFSNHFQYVTSVKTFIVNSDGIETSIKEFGDSVAKLLVSTTKVFSKILDNYENSIL